MTVQTLDPFGYWPAQRSRIRPLGGPDKADDGNYVFHTSYVAQPPGPAMAEVSFADLEAEAGMIAVRIFQHLPGARPEVTEQGKLTALLPSLAKTKRSMKLAFEAVPGARYAVMGYVFGECDAHATAIDVTLGPRSTEMDDPSHARSLFGRMRARRVAGLSGNGAPSLAWPVSQGFTPDQTREAHFARLTAGLPPDLPVMQRWETAYIVRVLEHYGRMEAGARGMGLARSADPAASAVAAAGCDVQSIIVEKDESVAGACARHFNAMGTGRGFDFIWSRSAVLDDADSTRALGMIEELLERLRPGGLGVHLFTTSHRVDRNALNRVVLGIAALGHIAAQLRHAEKEDEAVPFGIIVRRSTDDVIA